MLVIMQFRLNAVDFVIPKKGESLIEAYETWRKWADEKGIIRLTIIVIFYNLLFHECLLNMRW